VSKLNVKQAEKTGRLYCFGCRREIKEGENHNDPILCPYSSAPPSAS